MLLLSSKQRHNPCDLQSTWVWRRNTAAHAVYNRKSHLTAQATHAHACLNHMSSLRTTSHCMWRCSVVKGLLSKTTVPQAKRQTRHKSGCGKQAHCHQLIATELQTQRAVSTRYINKLDLEARLAALAGCSTILMVRAQLGRALQSSLRSRAEHTT